MAAALERAWSGTPSRSRSSTASWWRPSRRSRAPWLPTSPGRRDVRMVSVRPGVLPLPAPRPVAPGSSTWTMSARQPPSGVISERRDDDVEVLARAAAVIGVGAAVAPRRLRPPLAAGCGSRSRAGGDPQGDGQRLGAEGPPGRHHRSQHRTTPLRRDRLEREVQPHGRRARRPAPSWPSTTTPTHRSSPRPTSGIVGDWHEVIPALTEAIRRAGRRTLPTSAQPA